MDGPSVLAALTNEVLTAAEAIGLSRASLVAGAGLDAVVLANPDDRVPLAAHFKLWELLSREPRGLDLGARLGLAGMGVVGYAMQHGATVGDALAWQQRYRTVIHPDVVPVLERRTQGGAEWIVFARPISPAFARLREPVEAQAAAIVAVMRTLASRPLSASFVALPLPRPADPTRQEHFFVCPIAWSAPRLEVAFDAALLDAPLPRSDPHLFGYLARRADQLQATLPEEQTWSARVMRQIEQAMARGEPRLADVAKRLALSERTLHRRLESEGSTFATLLDGARRERASLLLDDVSLTVGEVAFLLGYSEAAAFMRAFKRWTGETPSSYRQRRLQSGA